MVTAICSRCGQPGPGHLLCDECHVETSPERHAAKEKWLGRLTRANTGMEMISIPDSSGSHQEESTPAQTCQRCGSPSKSYPPWCEDCWVAGSGLCQVTTEPQRVTPFQPERVSGFQPERVSPFQPNADQTWDESQPDG
jgi:hypothetical protein